MGIKARHGTLCSIILTLCVLFPPQISAKKNNWFKYENGFFVAYSNAPKRRATALLEDLERFRAAFIQISNVKIPASAPKTVVIITRDAKEFSKLIASDSTLGFAFSLGGRTIIVMPATGGNHMSSATIIRHEMGHAMLRYIPFRYPAWYEEGFAELVSSTTFEDKGTKFTFGRATLRSKLSGEPLIRWNDLVDEEFDLHGIPDAAEGSSAYFQSWLLTHYATLGDEGRNTKYLQSYFDLLKKGVGSSAAFRVAFEMSADDLWKRRLKKYRAQIPYYIMPFKPTVLDEQFGRSSIDDSELQSMLEYFEMRATAFRGDRLVPDPLASLAGHWDWLMFEGACKAPQEITVDRESQSVTFQSDQDVRGQWEPATYTYSRKGGASVQLFSRKDGRTTSSWRLHMPSEDLLCARLSRADTSCQIILKRCR